MSTATLPERPEAITLKGNPMTLLGSPLEVGQPAPAFSLRAQDMSPKSLDDFAGKVRVLIVVPSVDTPVCDTEVRRFNQEATGLSDDVVILSVSVDTPPALKRWCGAAGVDKVVTLSDFYDHQFGIDYGVRIKEIGLLARAVFVIDADGKVVYAQTVGEVADEPNYTAALDAVKACL
ncbi:MAG: thiol peroxidase [Planctomycetota bacterium]